MITEHFRQVPSFRCMPWADPEGGQGVRTPPPPEKSQKYRVSLQYWSGSPKNHKATKPAFNGGPLTRSSLTTSSDKMFWIRACMQCVWTGSIEIKLSTDIISWYSCDKGSDEPAQVCILKSSIVGSGMSSITAFMLNGSLILCLTTQTTTWKKALLYISLYKQTNLANLLSCLTLWFARLFF